MAASPSETDLTIATDIAQVVDDGDNLRVLPIVGRGVAQNVKDVLFLRGVDMGITQANVLKHYAKTGELGANFIDQVVYVAKLFNEEVHIVVRSDVTDIKQLNGKVGESRHAGKRHGHHRTRCCSTTSASRCRNRISTTPTPSRS